MSETDIYKNKQRMPAGKTPPPKRRRTRSSRRFDEPSRKRRSKNSGLRRLAHLFRKSENEKAVWYTFFIAMAIMLSLIGIWQFWYLDYAADKEMRQAELLEQIESDHAQSMAE